jgi:hypothetical protein
MAIKHHSLEIPYNEPDVQFTHSFNQTEHSKKKTALTRTHTTFLRTVLTRKNTAGKKQH